MHSIGGLAPLQQIAECNGAWAAAAVAAICPTYQHFVRQLPCFGSGDADRRSRHLHEPPGHLFAYVRPPRPIPPSTPTRSLTCLSPPD